MTMYDVVDEATIAAAPAEIVQALLDEAAGRSQWWQPQLRMRQRGTRPPTEIGAIVDIIISGGGLAQRWATVRFSGRVTAFEPDRRLALDYFGVRPLAVRRITVSVACSSLRGGRSSPHHVL